MISSDETKTDRPRWLINVDEYIEEEQDIYPSVAPYYEIVRDMLLEPEDSDSAVPNAVTKFYDLHTAAIEEEMAKETSEPEKLAGYKLNTIADIAFEIARDVFYTTFEHERLAKLLIGIKKGAANEYDEAVNISSIFQLSNYVITLIETQFRLPRLGPGESCSRGMEC